MRNLAMGVMVMLGILGTAGMVLGGTAGDGSREEAMEAFSPLFGNRLEIGVQRLDQPADRVHAPVLMAAERVYIIASGTPQSYCIGSACIGSTCLGSACLGSGCIGSACSGSTCAGSGCLGSLCLGSLCIGSNCVGSACSSCGTTSSPSPEEA
jgi:hypothetical protein